MWIRFILSTFTWKNRTIFRLEEERTGYWTNRQLPSPWKATSISLMIYRRSSSSASQAATCVTLATFSVSKFVLTLCMLGKLMDFLAVRGAELSCIALAHGHWVQIALHIEKDSLGCWGYMATKLEAAVSHESLVGSITCWHLLCNTWENSFVSIPSIHRVAFVDWEIT